MYQPNRRHPSRERRILARTVDTLQRRRERHAARTALRRITAQYPVKP